MKLIAPALTLSLALLPACTSPGLQKIQNDPVNGKLLTRRGEMWDCYTQKSPAGTEGTVRIGFEIAPDGHVTRALPSEQSTLKLPEVQNCIADIIRHIQFDPRPGDGAIRRTFSLKFGNNQY